MLPAGTRAQPEYPRATEGGRKLTPSACTFSTGPHACIGYRLALNELKVALFALLRAFAFAPLPSNPAIERTMMFTLRPEVKGEPGSQMPLMVRPV